jgi:hypothetical protein
MVISKWLKSPSREKILYGNSDSQTAISELESFENSPSTTPESSPISVTPTSSPTSIDPDLSPCSDISPQKDPSPADL